MSNTKKEIQTIPRQIIEQTTKEYLDKLTYRKKEGLMLMLYNTGLRQHAQGLKKGEATKTNIVTKIALEAIKNHGIDPDVQEETYNRIRLKVRSEIVLFIKANPEIEKKFLAAVKKFQKFEKIGNSGIGKALNKTAKKAVKLRNARKINLSKRRV